MAEYVTKEEGKYEMNKERAGTDFGVDAEKASVREECSWERVADDGDVALGTCLRVTCEGIDIAIFNADGELYAIGDTCTHAEASLCEGDFYEDIKGWVAECPLHGSTFDVTTGAAISLPATGNVGKYPVKIEDGVVYVSPQAITPRKE
jgi:3-phenylpropionate/trans-cinnamate dioxygenase ferredoxin subunit